MQTYYFHLQTLPSTYFYQSQSRPIGNKRMKKNQTNILPKYQKGQINFFTGKVTSINQGLHFYNITLQLQDKSDINIKLEPQTTSPIQGQIYHFKTVCLLKNEELILMNQTYNLAYNVLDMQTLYETYLAFYECAPISFAIVKDELENYLHKIKNKVLKQITYNLYCKNKNKFLISKAALKIHHNYYGGLGYHTLTMLKMAESLLKIYPFLNSDLLFAGTILHDMEKIKELDLEQKNYTPKGLLLGHLVMVACEVEKEAQLLGFQDKEEVLLLKHMLISHHGLLEHGAAKRPQIGEALLLWYLDNIDCKLTSLQEFLQKTTTQTFTNPIPVLEKKGFYKSLDLDQNNDDE
ncbi:HD domain-containing protein ['Catharanthus roseus' aster yellows phytoplasma]|nr:HD domain-containing protein ['Catharanthus roseus' aster yellows phytoplasma]